MKNSLLKKKINGDQTRKSYQPKTFVRLIAKRNWAEIENILLSSSIDWAGDGQKGIIGEDSIVHFALRYRAPLNIIKLLAKRYPLCITRPDATGKFACHVAAKYGAEPMVMEYLVRNNKHAAGVQDPLGKAPIHYVGEFYASNYGDSKGSGVLEKMFQVVCLLKDVAPQSFNLEDNEGMNAIEYAIENDTDIKIIKTMQRTARDDWRTLKANGQGKKHEDLAKDIERAANEARMKIALNEKNHSTSFRRDDRLALARDMPDRLVKSFVAKSA
jgi:hypothetical protein